MERQLERRLDDLGRRPDAGRHGAYETPGALVHPGSCRVRGLVRPKLRASCQMAPSKTAN